MSIDDPLIGKKLGDYTIQKLLGRGGMSRVYQGYDENLQRYAAVKVISGDFATTTEEEYTRRFTSEARAIAHLRHNSIVGVYQFGRTEGIYYMAQVFLEGKDLRQLLKEYADQNKRMPAQEIVRIVGDVAVALDYAHEQGVIHRDIKPSNIMLEKRTGRAILMDFGLALSIHEGTMGDTFGSAHYIAPEQAVSSAKAVPQSDLYSLGVVIYEMVTGKVPFDDPSVMSVALKHLNELPPPPTMYNPDLTPGVEAVIMRMLDKDPKRRYPTGQAMADDLERAFAGQDTASKPVLPDKPVGLGVLDMLDEPSKPDKDAGQDEDEERKYITHPKPRISTASAKSDEIASGIGGRFARRRARREEAAQQEDLSEAALHIDDDTLGSLLDSMPDPSEIGLVGEKASGVTPPPRRYTDSQAAPVKPSKKRRSRLGVLLPMLLVLAILAGGLYAGSQLTSSDEDDDNQAITAQTATAIALAAAETTDTPEPTITASEEPTATDTEEPTDEPTRASATGQPTGETTTAAVDGGPATEPLTDTEEPTQAPTATHTDEPTATHTDEPTATHTDEPTATHTDEPTATHTDEPTATHTDEPTEPAATAVAEVTYKPNIRLEYNQDEFILYNISGETLDISNLVFEQELHDGRTRRFTTTTWSDNLIDPPSAMRKDSCYQLLTSNAFRNVPNPRECPLYQGYFRSLTSSRYFWLAEEPGASFTVRQAEEGKSIATCPIDAGACEFYAGDIEDAEIIQPTVVPPTLVPGMEPNIHLIYDRDKFILINVSDQTLDISNLVFEQDLPTGSERVFLTAEWDEEDDMVGTTAALPAGGCYELVSSEGAWVRPPRDICPSFRGWFRSNVAERYFWRSSRPGATFIARYANTRTPLTVCDIEAGECSFYLPTE